MSAATFQMQPCEFRHSVARNKHALAKDKSMRVEFDRNVMYRHEDCVNVSCAVLLSDCVLVCYLLPAEEDE